MRENEGTKTLPAPSSSSQETGPLLQLPYSESGDADMATDASSSYISVSQDGSTLNVSSGNYNPGDTPVSLGTLSRLPGTSLLNAPVSISQSAPSTDQSVGQNSADSNLSKVLGLLASTRPLVCF